MTPELLTGVLRAVLAAIGGSLVSQGYVTEDQVNQITGALVVVAVAGWSVYSNYKQAKAAEKSASKLTAEDRSSQAEYEKYQP